MSNIFQFDSISISNFTRFNFSGKDDLSGEEGDGMKRQIFVPTSGRRSFMVRVFLLIL